MIRIKLIFFFCVGILFGQTKWSKCKVDDTKLRECLDGEVKKKEWNECNHLGCTPVTGKVAMAHWAW